MARVTRPLIYIDEPSDMPRVPVHHNQLLILPDLLNHLSAGTEVPVTRAGLELWGTPCDVITNTPYGDSYTMPVIAVGSEQEKIDAIVAGYQKDVERFFFYRTKAESDKVPPFVVDLVGREPVVYHTRPHAVTAGRRLSQAFKGEEREAIECTIAALFGNR